MPRLSKNVFCPIHHSLKCCGRTAPLRQVTQKKGWRRVGPGLWRIDDPHHPRGYRERRSTAQMNKLLIEKVKDQDGLCPICNKGFDDMREVTPDHIRIRGTGGAWRDDHQDNIRAVHGLCNTERGSKPA